MPHVALITGATGGIGRATAVALIEQGWDVYATDLRAGDLPASARFIPADLADPHAPERIVTQALQSAGRLDLLVNNAAAQAIGPITRVDAQTIDRLMAVNVRAPMLLIRHAAEALTRAKGSIVNIASVHAAATSRDISIYAATKGALLALTRAAALELAPAVRVNAVLPGATDTPMLRDGLSRDHAGTGDLVARLNHLAARHPLHRVASPSDIAQAVLFLADNAKASFITGQSLTVDGGALARLSTE